MDGYTKAFTEFVETRGLSEDQALALARYMASGNLSYAKLPVDPRTFVEHPEYMNAKGRLYPEVMRCFVELVTGPYIESVHAGAIGAAKTTLALYVQAYSLYELSCYEDPHALFNLDPASEILIVFQTLSATLAKAVDYARFREMIAKAPYFSRYFPFDRKLESEMRFRNRIIVKPITGQDTGAIGQNVIGGVLDELNFMEFVEKSKRDIDGGSYDQAVRLYEAISRRRKSRFLTAHKRLPGVLCLVSSARAPGEFTARKEREAADPGSGIYVYRKRVWDIRPWDFSGKMFRVFIGDSLRKPRILDDTSGSFREGEVVEIPVEFRRDFETDILNALRDIAGVATQAIHPFILDTEAIARCFEPTLASCFSREETDFEIEGLQIHPDNIEAPEQPRFVHVDLSVSGDRTGLAVGYVRRFVETRHGDDIEIMPEIRIDGLLRIRPPPNGEIRFDRIRKVLYALREAGVNLRWVSLDSFQSVDMIQILRQRGFLSSLQSIDRTPIPYDVLKTAIYDHRLHVPPHAHALHEIRLLERDTKKNKVDHPPNGCFTGETRVALADGTVPTFRELAERPSSEPFFVYSIGAEGVRISPAYHARVTKTAKELVEVLLDNFQIVRCTPEHLFMTLDGRWVQARNLTPDVPLMPLYRVRAYKGGTADYERVWCPIRNVRIMTHHLAAGVPEDGDIVHHRDGDKGNNDPRNLEHLSREAHRRHHGVELWEARREKMRDGFSRYFADPKNREASRVRLALTRSQGKLPQRTVCALEGCGSVASARGLCGLHYQRARRASQHAVRTSKQQNHRILTVRRVVVTEQVYDLSVPGTENFALASGVFVHNSKDVADALAGVVYGLTFRREVWALHNIPPSKVPTSLVLRAPDAPEEE